jgi:outer membrane protein TolC
VDTALFSAELSRAKIELLNYEKYLETQKVSLAELLGKESLSYSIDSSYFHILPSEISDSASINHPLIVLTNTRLLVNQQQRTTIQRTLYPKLGAWGTTYARGSGIAYNGVANSSDGLSFSRYNYGVGLQLSVPLLRFADVRYQLRSQDALIHAQEERLNLVKLQLSKENKIADVTLSKAFEVAKESPVFFHSAEFSYHALQTRYNTGLTNYADLIQSQYGLVKAETDLKKSYLEVWKALLYKAAVKGDVNLFLNQVK